MSISSCKFAVSVVCIVLTLTGCGGSGGGDGPALPAAPVQVPVPGPAPAPALPVIVTTVGAARVEKTILPGVLQLPEGVPLTRVDDTTFSIPALPQGLQNGSVFTWRDRAYVATAVNQSPGSATITVREAQLSQVLGELKVQGDLSMADIPADALTWDDSPELAASTAPAATDPQVSAQVTRVLANGPRTAAKCEATEQANSGVRENVSCTIDRVFQDGVAYTGTIGMKRLKFNQVSLNYKENKLEFGKISGSLFAEGGIKMVNAQNKEQKLELDIPLVRVRAAIPQTLGFVRVEVPLGLEFSIPAIKLQLVAALEVPVDDVAGATVAIRTPVATVSTDQSFKYAVSDAFAGAKAGVELVVGVPHLGAVQFFQDAKEDDKRRLLTIGGYYKLGFGGALAYDQRASDYCLEYQLGPTAGTSVEVSANLVKRDLSLKGKWEGVKTQPFETGKIDGHSGGLCDANKPAWHATFEIKSCDAVREFGSGYPCNAHGGWGFGSWTRGAFWLADSAVQANNMVYMWQINEGTFTGYEPKAVAFNEQLSTTFDVPVRYKTQAVLRNYRENEGSPYTVKEWPGFDEVNILRFVITERTSTSLSGTFSSSNSYYRYTDEPYSDIFGHLELKRANSSGTWRAQKSTLPTITGSEGFDGCGYISVTSTWLAYTMIATGQVTETGPVCSISR